MSIGFNAIAFKTGERLQSPKVRYNHLFPNNQDLNDIENLSSALRKKLMKYHR